MTRRARHDLIRDQVDCPACKALAGTPCFSRIHRPTPRLHTQRFYAATLVLCTCPKIGVGL